MRFSTRYLIGGTLTVYVITTAIMLVSFFKKHSCDNIYPYDALSVDRLDYSLFEFVSISQVLRSQIEETLKSELPPAVDDTLVILDDLKALNNVMHQMERHVDERAARLVLSQPVINYHNFSYIHNPTYYCTESQINVILIIPSATTNFEKRMAARRGNKRDYVLNVENRAKLLFFLGSPSRGGNIHTVQKNIDQEMKEFGDIVQEDFEDSYKNNRLKSVSMLRWVSTYCSTAKFVLRTDDDIEVNVSALISVLHRTSHSLNNFIIGMKRTKDPPRRDNSKYYISEQEYPYPVFPPYLLGGLLGYPVSTARLLYEAAMRTQPIWLEDVYITGICAYKLHIPILEDPEFVFKHE
ncbi:unnamed protein product [Candidula unifasciata]|uniref:Hexosyltransferase n=1 Tax=Candidula unifasciata TaxID=100452 RepID=A0A8S3ZA01_9EUPU|nr:unnamed protein product [Candidula unifasciata]